MSGHINSTWETLSDSWRSSTRHLESMGADLSGLHRLSSIFDVQPTVMAMPCDVSEPVHRCAEDECCEDRGGEWSIWGPKALAELAKPGWVYAYITELGHTVYIGKTSGRLPDRIRQHQREMDKVFDDDPKAGALWSRANLIPHRTHASGSRSVLQCIEILAAWHLGDSCRRLEKAAILVMQPVLNSADLT